MSKIISKFGESHDKPLQQWFETQDELRYDCNENTISYLHSKWIVSPFAKRSDDERFVIFEFTTPQEFNI